MNCIVERSMDSGQKMLVNNDLSKMKKDKLVIVVTFKCITNHVVIWNQGTMDALQGWIYKFDIYRMDGQNVLDQHNVKQLS